MARGAGIALMASLAAPGALAAGPNPEPAGDEPVAAATDPEPRGLFPLLADEARARGYELPLPMERRSS
jgi:hypothetical protein